MKISTVILYIIVAAIILYLIYKAYMNYLASGSIFINSSSGRFSSFSNTNTVRGLGNRIGVSFSGSGSGSGSGAGAGGGVTL